MTTKPCTCGEPPMSGHYLWCCTLRGQSEYRPARVGSLSAEEIRAARRAAMADSEFVGRCDAALDGDSMALQIVCNVLNARSRLGDRP